MSQVAEANRLVEQIRPILAGQNPEIVGAALGELLAILIASHAPVLRDEIFEMTIDMARDLVAPTIEEMIEAGRVGPEWRGTQQ